MKKHSKSLFFILSLVIATACTTEKDIAYLQNLDQVQLQEITTRYEAKIKKDDLLNIVVSGPDKQVVMPYNLTLSDNGTGGYNPENSSLPYLVDCNGEINFPILGKIRVEGMTRSQLRTYLTEQISKDVKDPIVYISFKNYKITVLGDVAAPGVYTMDSEKITVFQALGRAGDLNLTAKRDGILLLREVNGNHTYYTLDLKDANIMNQDYFYMQQNDVLYVPASEKRINAANTNTTLWGLAFSSISTLMAIITFVLSLTR